MQLQENLKENPFGFGWQLETLYCTSQLHGSQGQRFQGSLCSGAVCNGLFLAASDCPFPIPLAGCCWNGSGHFYVEGTMQRRHALLMLHGSVHLRPLHPTDWALLLYSQTLILPTHSSRLAAYSAIQRTHQEEPEWHLQNKPIKQHVSFMLENKSPPIPRNFWFLWCKKNGMHGMTEFLGWINEK